MGQGQFMPSSFLNYAVDYDKDKIVDIWNSHYDIFASIANYLKSHGWKKQNYWSVEVQVKEDFKKKIQENINYNISIFKNAKLLDNFANSKEINSKIIKNNEKSQNIQRIFAATSMKNHGFATPKKAFIKSKRGRAHWAHCDHWTHLGPWGRMGPYHEKS